MTRNGLIYALGNAANSAALFMLIPFLVRVFPPSVYGAWVQIELLLGLLGLLSAAGLEAGLHRFTVLEADPQRRRRVVGTLYLLIGLNALLVLLLIVAGGRLLPGSLLGLSDSTLPPDLLLLIGLAVLGEVLFNLTLNVLRAQQRAVPFVLLNFARLLLLVSAVMIGVSTIGGLHGGLIGRIVAVVLPLAGGLLLIRRSIGLRPDGAVMRAMLRYGLPILLVNVTINLLYAADRYVLQALTSLELTAYYAFAYKIASLPDVLITRPYALDWGPRRFLIAAQPDAAQRFGRAVLSYLAIAGSTGLIVLALTPLAFSWFAPPAYRTSIDTVPWLIAAYLAFGLSTLLNNGAFLRDATRRLPPRSAAALAAYLVLLLLLIPPFGMLGAALATLAAYALLAWFLARLSQRLYPIQLPWPKLGAVTALLIVGALVLQLIGNASHALDTALTARLAVAAGCILLIVRIAFGPLRGALQQLWVQR